MILTDETPTRNRNMKPTLTLTFETGDELAKFVAGHFGSGQSQAPVATPVPATAAPMVPTMPTPTTAAPENEDDDQGAPAADATGVDADGLPWDERIHAPSKSQNKDGTWRKKKKLEDAFVAGVEAELRSVQRVPAAPTPPPAAPGAPAMPAAPTPPPMPQVDQQPAPAAPGAPAMPAAPTPPPMPQVDQQPAPAAPGAPAMPAAPTPPPETAPAPAAEGIDFHTFMQQLSAQMQKRDETGQPVINADYLAQATAEISGAWSVPLNAITDIPSNPQMITYAIQVFQRDGKWD